VKKGKEKNGGEPSSSGQKANCVSLKEKMQSRKKKPHRHDVEGRGKREREMIVSARLLEKKKIDLLREQK